MKIGIPKALLYYKYAALWERFFDALGIEYIVSPDANKDIVSRGMSLAVDESCLSFKTYLGHVDWLIDRCDCIFVPRISDYGKAGTVCTRFQAIYDLVKNTFREKDPQLLHYNIGLHTLENEPAAFIKLGRALGKSRAQSLLAYLSAKQAENEAIAKAAAGQKELLLSDGIKVLVISHCYNIYDTYSGEPVLRTLRAMGAVPVIGCDFDPREAATSSLILSDTVPWLSSKELLGAAALYHEMVDGIIILSAFPCGPDSMVNEVVIRRIKDKPVLNLILDAQEGTAGLETRLESFIDIIRFRSLQTTSELVSRGI